MIGRFSARDSATFHTRMLSTSSMSFLVLASPADIHMGSLLIPGPLDLLHPNPGRAMAFSIFRSKFRTSSLQSDDILG